MQLRRLKIVNKNTAQKRVSKFSKKEFLLLSVCILFLTGCNTDMWIQAKVKSYHESPVFPHNMSARPLVAGTVAKGQDKMNLPFQTGYQNGKYVEKFPMPLTKAVLERGQDRFNIFCSPCHGRVGDAKGMITQRGLKLYNPPPSFHTDRLRSYPIGHIFSVITNGTNVMYSYADRIEPKDRWAIVAYVRALQLSQNASLQDVPSKELKKLKADIQIQTGEKEKGHRYE